MGGLVREGGVSKQLLSSSWFRRAAVDSCSQLVDDHADVFAELLGALLGEKIEFDAPTEKWIVWPAAAGSGPDPREAELGAKGIRVVAYEEREGRYTLRVGRAPAAAMRSG